MKEAVIFIVLFLIVFAFTLIIFNGRFIYAQVKYKVLGPKPTIPKDAPQRLVIPKIGVDAPVIALENIDEQLAQKGLEQGIVNYPDSNVFLGHSSAYPWYKGEYGSIFSLLNKLDIGDEILVFSKTKKYTYQIIEKQIKLPKDLELKQTNDKSIIYLVSCWPINTAWKRIVVKAKTIDKK